MNTVVQTISSLNPHQLYRFLLDSKIVTTDSSAQPAVVVALSGGLDSMVMLRLMLELRYQYQINFSAIHINHGLSENADDWQSFVTQFCQINAIELSCHQLSLEKTSQRSLEQIARDARYAVFADSLPVGTFVLTGHHLLDQVETFMMRLSRGSGSKGLSGMRVCADLPNSKGQSKKIRLVRPLLAISKQELKDYGKAQFLDWIEDESNECLDFDRNFVRHKISPALTERWPHMPNAIKTTTGLLARESELLSLYLKQDLSDLTEDGVFALKCLNLAKLAKLDPIKQPELVRLFITNLTTKSPSRNVLTEVMTTVMNSKVDSQAVVEFSGYSLRQYKGFLYCLSLTSKALPQTLKLDPMLNEIELNSNIGQQSFSLLVPPGSLYTNKKLSVVVLPNLFKEQNSFNQAESDSKSDGECLVEVKWGHTNEKIQPNAKSGNKKVSELLKQKSCPAWLRDRVPKIYINDELVAVGDVAVAYQWQPHLKISYEEQ
ncbi:tRNA lysidine(34) synthetase TilS [Psychrosphaera sp.]|nr:tRNA lysidine(34) synthetase TilS [Psychrosphaera sp.]